MKPHFQLLMTYQMVAYSQYQYGNEHAQSHTQDARIKQAIKEAVNVCVHMHAQSSKVG